MRASHLASLVLLAPLFTACGGADEGRPERPIATASAALDECAAAEQRLDDGWEFQTIADFERPEGETRVKWQAACSADTPCEVYFNFDSVHSPAPNTACSEALGLEIELTEGMGRPYVAPMPEARCETSETAYHLTAKNVAVCLDEDDGRQGWGATLALTFKETLDVSEWDGISFWVRRGEGSSNQAFLATARDPFTSSVVGVEGYCSGAENAPDATKCDAFGLAVLLDSEWSFVTIPFAHMRQKGFGVPSPNPQLDVTQLRIIELVFSAGDWDFWFDDLSFYREPK